MPKPRFTLYKHIKIGGTWRYCRAAVAVNNKVKPHIVVVGGTEEKHEDGSYCVRHKNQWIEVGNDPAEALRRPMAGNVLPQKTILAAQGHETHDRRLF